MNQVQTPALGQPWPEQGGIYIGLIRGQNGQPDYHLIRSEAIATSIAWGGYGEDEPGAAHSHDGLANTISLVQSKHTHPAAEWAASLETAGFKDWYLPAQAELVLGWINAPGDEGWFWSSTQFSRYDAWGQTFGDGYTYIHGKSFEGKARAVRRFIP